MKIFYKSQRVGKHGRLFTMYKVRTLKENTDKTNSFASQEQYTVLGRFLRKTKIDELPQLWNLIKGDLRIVGPRAEEQKTVDLLPEDIKEKLLSIKPGLTSLSSIHYFEEGQLLEKSPDPHLDYWTKIKPSKILLDFFYIDNRCFMLDIVIVWLTIKKIIKSFFKK